MVTYANLFAYTIVIFTIHTFAFNNNNKRK